MPTENAWHGTTRFAAYVCDTAVKPWGKPQSDSEPYEPQKSGDDSPVFAFAKPRAGKSRERSEAVGWLECGVVQFNLRLILVFPFDEYRQRHGLRERLIFSQRCSII